MESKKIFAKGYCSAKYFLIFVVFSILGAFYEELLNFLKIYFSHKTLVWSLRQGVIYGPFSPIYGAGAVILVKLLSNKNYSYFKTFFYGFLIGGAFEYVVNFLQETFVGTKSWDYSNHILNINGRTTIPIMIFWGLGTLILIKFVYPHLSKLIEKIPYNFGNVILKILVVFLSLDMFISWTALIRQNLRRNNIPPITPIDKIYDKYYTDKFLAKYFPNMVAVKRR